MPTDVIIKEKNTEDLNSKLFYKISFSIRSNKGYSELDLLWEVVLHIKKWLEYKERKQGKINIPSNIRKWTSFKNGCKLYDAKKLKTFYAESKKRIAPDNNNDISWACRIRECEIEKGYAPRWWTTEIGFQTMNNESARLSVVLSYGDAMGFIGECLETPEISIPRIVKNIQEDERFMSSIKDDPLLFQANELRSGDGNGLKELIYDQDRGIPLILIMPKRDYLDKTKINLPIDPHEMIRSVAGNALVYYSCDLNFVEEFENYIDNAYRCTPGMIRYYLPNVEVSNPSDASRHRFIHYDEAISLGTKKILRIFRRVVSQDINDYDRLFRYADCLELIRRDSLNSRMEMLETYRKNHEENKGEKDELTQKLEDMEYQLLEKDIEKEDLEKELEEKKKENYKLNTRLDDIMATYESLSESKAAYDFVREIDTCPSSVMDVCKHFATVFKDRIVFTEKGWKSLKDCKTSADVLWKALYTMVTLLYDCLETCASFSEALKKYNEQSPYECVAGNTATTKKDKNIQKQYQDFYNGEIINIEPHLKSSTGKESDSRFFRIYFNNYKNKKTGKRMIVVGSCGSHMTTAGTMRR